MRGLFPVITDDPEARRAAARRQARGKTVPQALIDRAMSLAPLQRVRLAFRKGLIEGAAYGLRAAAAHTWRLPSGVTAVDDRSARAWAQGIAAAAALPAVATFPRLRPEQIIAAYRAGYERGILLALEGMEPQQRRWSR